MRMILSGMLTAMFLPFRSKAKNAQEAHEAIRPTQPALQPEQLPKGVPKEAQLLYSLIWRRTVATQMTEAIFKQVCDPEMVLRHCQHIPLGQSSQPSVRHLAECCKFYFGIPTGISQHC